MGLAKFFQSLTNSAVRRELYEFTRGDTKFYYTSGDKSVQDGEVIYEAITLTRSAIESSSDLEKNSIDITFALNSKFAQDCLRSALEENILVKVSKLQFGNTSTLWQGRVTAVKPDGVEITLKCETDYTSLGRTGARYKYQRTCCHDLYGNGCKLDKSLWGIQTTIKSVDKLHLELRGLSAEDGYFRLGMLQSNTGVNVAIESSSGQSVILIRRLDTLADQVTTDEALLAYNNAKQALIDAQNTASIAQSELAQAISDRDALDPLSPTYEQDLLAAQEIVDQKQLALDISIQDAMDAQVEFDLAAESVFFVTVFPGCMKSLTACNRFNNTDNFLGFSYKRPDLCSKSTGAYGLYSAQHGRLNAAAQYHRDSALESASWGIGQVMGYHWKALGYPSLQVFINAMYKDEAAQLDAMCRYIKVNNLVNALKNKHWKAFARGYNGQSYAKNSYDIKLANAYKKWSQ